MRKNPKILPGGGATEMAIEKFLLKKAGLIKNSNFYIYKSIALGFEIIPKILIENCGVSSVSSLNILKYHHANDKKFFGIDGKNGNILDTRKIGLFESFDSKIQLIKSSLENCAMLLRVDRYLKGFSGIKSRSAIK